MVNNLQFKLDATIHNETIQGCINIFEYLL
jgi:hypothetical protein